MKTALPASFLIALLAVPGWAAGDTSVERMATCQDSWLDWSKADPARMTAFGDGFRADFSPNADGTFFVPKTAKSVAGLRVTQVYPESLGMGVGFSVVVDAPFDTARSNLEKLIGKPLVHCEASDNMRSCELQLGEERTLTLMAEDNAKSTTTLLGCYYYYEK